MTGLLRSADTVRLVISHNASGYDSEEKHADSVHSVSTESLTIASYGSPSILDIIKEGVPSLCDTSLAFKPSWLWSSGDVQTVFTNFAKIAAPLCYDRYFLPAVNGGTLAVDFISAPWLSDDAPVVIILPGVLGDSQSMYVSSATEELIKLRDGTVKAHRVVAMNARGTPGNPLSSPHLTHAGSTEDVRTVISYVRKSYPEARGLFALGFSMGGALLSNYLAEEGDTCPLDAGFCVSTVWDLEACSRQIEGSFFRRLLYSYSCGTGLTRVVREHERLFRDAGAVGLDDLLSRSAVRMSTFNDNFMSHLAGHSDTKAFAEATSPISRVNKIRRPCVLLNALDDPFYGGKTLETLEDIVRESGQENLVLAITKKGGHIGWLQRNEEGNVEQWFVHPIREFFDAILSEKEFKQSNCEKLMQYSKCLFPSLAGSMHAVD